eukprot:g9220.t1
MAARGQCETFEGDDDALLTQVELLQTHLDLQKKPDANSSKETSAKQLEDVVAQKLQANRNHSSLRPSITPKNLAFTSRIQKRAVGFLENAKTQGAIAVEKDTVLSRIFTKEDPYNVHKVLGFTVLSMYLYRIFVLDFAESCLMSLALWLRFGSADFAESFGWVERTDYAAMTALPSRAVDAAVSLWRRGMHATGAGTTRQRSVRQNELRAWNLGADKEQDEELRAAEDAVKLTFSQSDVKALIKCRASRVNQAGEVMVRQAYERLIIGQQHSLWDLWRKRNFVVQALLQGDDPSLPAVLCADDLCEERCDLLTHIIFCYCTRVYGLNKYVLWIGACLSFQLVMLKNWPHHSEQDILDFPWFTITILTWAILGAGLKFFSSVPLFDSRHARYVEARPKRVILRSKTKVSSNLYHLKFDFPWFFRWQGYSSGLQPGQHVKILCGNASQGQSSWNGHINLEESRDYLSRSYTPINSSKDSTVDFIIKLYPQDPQAGFPDGEEVWLSGPHGSKVYRGNGNFVVDGKLVKASTCCALAGGSGITPVLSLLRQCREECRSSFSKPNAKSDVLREFSIIHAMRNMDERLETTWYSPQSEMGLAPHCTVTHLATGQKDGELVRQISHREGMAYNYGKLTKEIIGDIFPPPAETLHYFWGLVQHRARIQSDTCTRPAFARGTFSSFYCEDPRVQSNGAGFHCVRASSPVEVSLVFEKEPLQAQAWTFGDSEKAGMPLINAIALRAVEILQLPTEGTSLQEAYMAPLTLAYAFTRLSESPSSDVPAAAASYLTRLGREMDESHQVRSFTPVLGNCSMAEPAILCWDRSVCIVWKPPGWEVTVTDGEEDQATYSSGPQLQAAFQFGWKHLP